MMIKTLLNSWTWKMAWRDSRASRKRLLLFVASIMLGVAALVAISSFETSSQEAIQLQAKELLGADLRLDMREPFNEPLEQLIDSLGGKQARLTTFPSMVYFPKSDNTRLSEIRAIDLGFPFYGKIDVEPAHHPTFFEGQNAYIEKWLALQYEASVGDSIQVGSFHYRIAGFINNMPGDASMRGLVSPRVVIPYQFLDATKLLQRGSLASYAVLFQFPTDHDLDSNIQHIEPYTKEYRLRYETVSERQDAWALATNNLYSFLNLVGFIALLLGAIGVASTIHVYIRQKIDTVAILRCLGVSGVQATTIYTLQALFIGLLGAILGAVIGVGLQAIIPFVLADFIPVDVPFSIAWEAIATGIGIGAGFTLLFALLPLLTIRKVSPLLTLRSSFETTRPKFDSLRFLIYLLIVGATVGFATIQTGNWVWGIWFTLGIFVALGVIIGVAYGVMWASRKFFPKKWSYVWRQGLSNLYRPNNQTVVLMLVIGLGTFLIATLYLTRSTLLNQVAFAGSGDRPNMILFDIQSHQVQAVEDTIKAYDLPILQRVPIVTMRLQSVKGKTPSDLLADSTQNASQFALQREYRTTYRSALSESETLLDGTFEGNAQPNDIKVSLEASIADNLKVGVGDELVWDVQGIPIKTTVGSIRKVDWQRVQTNFFVLFPTGVLEQAPQFSVIVTKVPSEAVSAQLQRSIVKNFPNISTIDLSLILETVDTYLGKISFVIQFMALFSIITGLVVLASSILNSRFQRIRESVLLRTLGASQKQVRNILIVEYLFLGFFATSIGLILAMFGGWTLAYFVFEAPYNPFILPLLIIFVVVMGVILAIGLYNSRGIHKRTPLEILRTIS